jgi:hypothetical protein
MILIHSRTELSPEDKATQMNLLEGRLSPFFINDDDFLFSTESNPHIVKELISKHKVYLLFVESLQEVGLTPDGLKEVITELLKNNGFFRSESDDLSIGVEEIDNIDSCLFYP